MANVNPGFSLDLDLLEKEIEAKERERRGNAYAELSGQIAGIKPAGQSRCTGTPQFVGHDTDFDTLDEPVWDTIRRDLKLVSAKFSKVLVPPSNEQNILRDWDLWGPLFICIALSLILQSGTSTKGPQFTQVFSLAFFGSCVVTLNIKLLGGRISFFQALCVIGYCLLPSVFAAIGCKTLNVFMGRETSFALMTRLLACGTCFLWSVYASMSFLAGVQTESRKLLGFYPVILFYFVVSWLVLSNS